MDEQVVVESLESFLTSSSTRSVEGFLREHQLNPTASFPFRAGEAEGSDVSLRAVLAAYADEPDWGIDQDLFTHYPQLWKEDYLYMGGKTGYQSRAFRHLYWTAGYYKAPTPPASVPERVTAPLGEAPQRAALFFQLAREAFASGHPYWGARFLSWSFHYVQDLTQPFHTEQLPSHALVRLKPDGSIDIEGSVRQVVYYHLALDGFAGKALEGALGPAGARVAGALSGKTRLPFADALGLAQAVARQSQADASDTGMTLRSFLPRPTAADLADPLGRVFSPGFWSELSASRTARPQEWESFLSLLEDLLRPAAQASRAMLEAVPAVPLMRLPVVPARLKSPAAEQAAKEPFLR